MAIPYIALLRGLKYPPPILMRMAPEQTVIQRRYFLDIFAKVVAILFKQTFATMLLAWKARMQKILTNSPIWQDMAMNSENIIKLPFLMPQAFAHQTPAHLIVTKHW